MAKGHNSKKPTGRKSSGWNFLFTCLVVLSYLAGIILGILVLIGCISANAGINRLYIAELRSNQTYDLSLRVGYFGGCFSIANTTQNSGQSSNNSSMDQQTKCLANLRSIDLDDLSEEFCEDLSLTSDVQNHVKATFNTTLPLLKHLQEDVFLWELPLFHFVSFVISGVMLFTAFAGTSHKRRYRAVLVIATLISAFSLSLALVTAIGSLQASNALLEGAKSKNQRMISADIYLSRAGWLDHLQAGLAAVAALFYVSMGVLFGRREPEGGMNIFQNFQWINNGFISTKKW